VSHDLAQFIVINPCVFEMRFISSLVRVIHKVAIKALVDTGDTPERIYKLGSIGSVFGTLSGKMQWRWGRRDSNFSNLAITPLISSGRRIS
jgi:hypothetical protein